MAKYKTVNGKKLAKYNFVRVDEAGCYVEDSVDGSPLEIQADGDGYKFVDDGWEKHYVDEAVLMGFGKKPKFVGSEGYVVEHIDKDIANNHKDNLRWKQTDSSKHVESGHVFFDGMKIGKDGKISIKEGKIEEQAQLRERWYCDHLNATWFFENPIMVTFEVGGRCQWHTPDEYMEKAGYVNGDKDSLKSPVILHRDFDVSNYHSDNLEWVESDDPRYIEYDTKRKERQKKLIKQHNQDLGYLIPSSWPQ